VFASSAQRIGLAKEIVIRRRAASPMSLGRWVWVFRERHDAALARGRTSGYECRMRSKTDMIREAWGNGDRLGALRIAARFFDRSEATKVMQRGHQAAVHPEFFRQVGKSPEALTAEALRVLAAKFNLPI